MKSLLYQEGSPFSASADCTTLPCRLEIPISIRKYGRIYNFVLRDRIIPEDPYLILSKATGFALRTGEIYNGTPPKRTVKDFLIKSSVIV